MFPPPALVPLILSKFLAEHVKGQLRLLILGGTMLDGGSLASNSSKHVPQHYPIIKHLVMDVLVDSVFKGLPYLHLTLWLLRGSLPQSLRHWWGQLKHLH